LNGIRNGPLKARLSKSLYTPEWEELCAILQELRESKDLTQMQLSALLRQPQSFVSKVEKGQRKLDLRQFVLYVRALDADPIQVLKRFLESFGQALR
jgi:transcriptional regulator with XRE-family HTH domain